MRFSEARKPAEKAEPARRSFLIPDRITRTCRHGHPAVMASWRRVWVCWKCDRVCWLFEERQQLKSPLL